MNSGMVTRARDFLHRHWRRALRWREKLVLKEEAFHLVLAGLVGVIGGLVNLFFYYGVHLIQPGDPVEVAGRLNDWERVLVPTLGGLAAGLVLHWGRRLVGPQGSTNLLEVVVAGDGRLPFRTEFVKTVSAIISIATGASIGREGGITQLAATLSSKLGQIAKWPPYRLRLLVGCGAASGIAAAYNAPIAGAVFSALIVLGNFSMNLFAPLVFSSVIAAMVSRSFFGIEPWYKIPPFPAATLPQLPWFVLLGVLCGVVGALFLKLLRLRQGTVPETQLAGLSPADAGRFDRGHHRHRISRRLRQWLFRDQRHFARKISDRGPAALVAGGIAGGKMGGNGGNGRRGHGGRGVHAHVVRRRRHRRAVWRGAASTWRFGGGVPAGAFALVGMGAVLAATTRSPLLAMIMIFELSLDYSLVPPLMLACVVSILVARQLHGESVYTEHLRVKGLALGQETSRPGATMEQTIGDLMRAPVTPVRESTPLREIADRFLTNSNNFLPVVDAQQRLLGVVALQDLKEFLNAKQDLGAVIAYDVMRPPPKCLTPGQRLLEALPAVLESELRNVPVVNNPAENKLVGAVVRAEVLAIFSEAIAAKSDPAR